jgi:hypothetical protein
LHIAIPIPTLRVGQVGNDSVRLTKTVDIRRIPRFRSLKKGSARLTPSLSTLRRLVNNDELGIALFSLFTIFDNQNTSKVNSGYPVIRKKGSARLTLSLSTLRHLIVIKESAIYSLDLFSYLIFLILLGQLVMPVGLDRI